MKSLYESLVTGIITGDEYRQMRTDYEERISVKINLVQELECRQNELEAQVSEYICLSDLIGSVKGKEDITAALIDRLIDRIEVFSDRRI